jgi:hypothetical protein
MEYNSNYELTLGKKPKDQEQSDFFYTRQDYP